jgi:hypothetical protein
MKQYSVIVSIMLVFLMAPFCNAESIKKKIVGTWRLVGYDDPNPSDNRPVRKPTGYIMYDATGHMAVQINRQFDRPKFKSGKQAGGTPEETQAAFANYTAYFGTYTIDEKAGTVTHHLEGSLFPNAIGSDNVRFYDLEGDRVIYTVPVKKDGKILPKSASHRKLTWEKVK